MERFRIAILGAGHIAATMAATVRQMEGAEIYAVASRSLERAEAFARQFGIARAYGSYEEMLSDPKVELVYVATPHSHHAEHARMCILHGKPALVEKAFTANARQAEEVLQLAAERHVLVTEAIWTRYMPFSKTIVELANSGIIGRPMKLSAHLSYPMADKERIVRPELAGGALLDIGVYCINFAIMAFGDDIKRISSLAVKSDTGVDMQDNIVFVYDDGRIATMESSAFTADDRQGIICGDKGYLIVDNINNPTRVDVYDPGHTLVKTVTCPPTITGYEFEVQACIDAVRAGRLECPDMPHAETLRIMRLMDGLREEWGVRYPFE